LIVMRSHPIAMFDGPHHGDCPPLDIATIGE